MAISRRLGATPLPDVHLSGGSAEHHLPGSATLAPLSLEETRAYVKLRLSACGARKQPLFDDDAIAALFDASGGVPRRINRIATAALIVAASRNKQLLGAQDVLDARLDQGRA